MKAPILNANLIESSNTFPESDISPEIPFDVKINELVKKFSPQKEIIILEGPSGSGKTVTLMQFAKCFPHTTFSYFLTDNYWVQRPSAFLSSLCSQMSIVLGIPFEDDDDLKIDIKRLEQVFDNFTRRIIDVAKREKTVFYFVIDGLEWAMNGVSGERIIDRFPLRYHPRGLYILGSITSSCVDKVNFSYECDEPKPFSAIETRHYLQDLNPTESQAIEIHKSCGGMPGYLSLMKRMLKEKQISFSSIINDPSKIINLPDEQWDKEIEKLDIQGKNLLAVLAYSLTPLASTALAEMLQIAEADVAKILKGSGLLKRGRDSVYSFYLDIHKSRAQNKLKNLRDFALNKLSSFYESHNQEGNSALLLPEYYKQMENYQAIQTLITPDHLTNTVLTQQDISIAQRNLGNAIELAQKNSDLGIMRFGLYSAQLRTLSNDVIGVSEVEALIAMEKYDQALELAYSSKLEHLRIRLLAKIYLAMEKTGKTISRDSILEIEHILSEIKVDELDPEVLLNLATDVFPLIPDSAVALVDRVKLAESQRSPMDLFALLATASSSNPENDDLIQKIQNSEIRDLALMNSPWLSKLSAKEIINRGSQAKQTKAKEYLYRQWCLQNRKDPNVDLVIEAALDAVLMDPDYHIPLRHLRQLSEPLKFCHRDKRALLARRFDAPNLVSLRSPIEERIRLELNVVEALFDLDQKDAISRYWAVNNTVFTEVLDTDVICYCLARLMIALNKIDLPNKSDLQKTIIERLDIEFLRLLETAADQMVVSRRILRSLTLVDPDLAIAYADMLNTINRRNIGVQDVLTAYVRQQTLPISLTTLNKGLEKITDLRIKEQTIYRIIEIAKETKILDQDPLKTFSLTYIKQISDSVIYCKSAAHILSTLNPITEIKDFDVLFSELLFRWENIDILWMRVESAMDIVAIMAAVDKACAEQLYDQARALRGSFALASQPIGVMFFETLCLATRVVGKLNLEKPDTKSTYDNLVKMIDLLPSRLLRILLLSQIAIGRIRTGDKKTFDNLVQERVLTELQVSPDSDVKLRVLSDIALCLFEYSPEEAYSWVVKLPYSLRNITWYKVAERILAGSNIFDPIDKEMLKTDLGVANINQVITILNYVERDQEFTDILISLCRALVNLNISEVQKLDALTKIEDKVKKLPDLENIQHHGYKVLAQSEIERSRRLSAKKSKARLNNNFSAIIQEARGIENIADRVLVLAHVAVNINESFDKEKDAHKQKQLSNQLLEEAFSLVPQIPNFQDRADRLKIIADSYSEIHNTEKALEALNLAKQIAMSFEGVERDQVLASLIQVAHQIDKDLAAQISEKLENLPEKHNTQLFINSLELSKAPHKLFGQYSNCAQDDEVMQMAASRMIKAIVNGHGVSYPISLVIEWLSTTKHLNFDATKEIVSWAIEATLRQVADSEINQHATNLLNYLLSSCEMLYMVGNHISFLEEIPQNLKMGFQGLSTNKRFFKVGERTKAVDFVVKWLRSTSKSYVKVCDPYFDPDQLWILQAIPVDIEVKIITTGSKLDLKPKNDDTLLSPLEAREKIRHEKKRLQVLFDNNWKKYSQQTPPPTLIVVHGTIFDTDGGDEFHDRYIITENSGLSIGTSFNGFGNKEFFITVLDPDDVKMVNETYINPKLNIQDYFSKVLYFEME